MSIVAKIIKVITRIFMYISYASISVLAVMTVFDVVRRMVFNRTLTGVTEYSQILLIISMASMAHALIEGRFIGVGVLVERFPKSINIAIEIIMGAASFAFFTIVGSRIINEIGMLRFTNKAYFMIKLPEWPFYLALGASFLACALGTIAYVYDRIVNFKSKDEKTIFDDNPDLAILALTDDEDTNIVGGGE